jgi:lipid II:glycine glycyltransferase (peptidoglycan interpeptide bridge formation enzyme)
MLDVDSSKFIFKVKKIWFSEVPFDVTGYDGVSFFECTRDVDMKGFTKEEFTTLVIDLTQDLDTIRKNMDRLCRRSIDTAKKDGVVTRLNEGYDTFYTINSEFRKAKGLSKYNVEIGFMKKNGILFLAEYEGKILGGHYHLCDGKNIRFLLNASKRLEETGKMNKIIANANRMMVWDAICYAKERGIRTFDMGGYYTGKEPDPQKEGINKFKSSFGGQVVTHYNYQKDYSKLYYCARKILSLKYTFRNFFMKYQSNAQ